MRKTYENSAFCDSDEPGLYGYLESYKQAYEVSNKEGKAWRLPSLSEMEAAEFASGLYWVTRNGEPVIYDVEEVMIAADLIGDTQVCLRLVRDPADDDMYAFTDKPPTIVAEPDSKTLFGQLLAATC